MADCKRFSNSDETLAAHKRGEIDIYWVDGDTVLARIKATVSNAPSAMSYHDRPRKEESGESNG